MVTSLCLSAAILIAIGLAYTFRHVWVVIPLIGVTILLVALGSPAVYTSTAVVVIITAGCAIARVRTARFWIAATAAACLPYLVIAPSMFATYREVQQLRRENPVESLTSRLAYEEPMRKIMLSSPYVADDPERKPTAVGKRMTEELQRDESYRRREALWMLFDMHVEFASDFMNTEGQGDDRTPRRLPPRRAEVELPEPEPIPVVPETEEAPGPDSTGAAPPDAEIASQADNELSGFHAEGVVDFVNPASFGALDWYSDSPRDPLERVIGFQAHAFRHRPQFPRRRGATWKIEQLQLVSLLKHPEPVAYQSDNLPRMDELREARTRPLTEFESKAVERLQAGEELVVHETRDTIEMLGAVRAMSVCNECHQVPRQTLLGAFTYRLRRPTPQGPKATL
jgi:hypothetical protein